MAPEDTPLPQTPETVQPPESASVVTNGTDGDNITVGSVTGETAPVLAKPPVEAPIARTPKVKGLTIGGMKKRVAIKRGKPEPASELREQLNELLLLLVTVRDANNRRWIDLKNADNTGAAAKLDARMRKLRFYTWRVFGEAHYLMTGHLTGSAARAVAYILPEGRGFKWTVENSRSTSGVETTLQKAKEVVMLYRDQFPA